MECQSEGIYYFADLVRHKRMLKAKALSVIALVPLLCQIDLIRIFSLLVVLHRKCDKDFFQSCIIPRNNKENI